MIRLRWTFVALPILVATLPIAGWAADSMNPAARSYLKYCGACHGPGGKGDGIVANYMTPKPTDLTALAKANKGEFPALDVMKVIDGRETVRAHGNSDMPVWGELLQSDTTTSTGNEAQIRGRVMLITDHIESLQVK